MHGLGNYHDAQTIYQWVRSHGSKYGRPSCCEDRSAPDGWEYVGAGCARSVWLSPEGVAYKVGHNDWAERQQRGEIDNLTTAWELGAPEGVRFPKFDSFDIDIEDGQETVVVIELIVGDRLYDYAAKSHDERDRLYDRLALCETRLKLVDLHDENALVDEDGLLVPVDFGC